MSDINLFDYRKKLREARRHLQNAKDSLRARNYSAAEKELHVADKLMRDLNELFGGLVVRDPSG